MAASLDFPGILLHGIVGILIVVVKRARTYDLSVENVDFAGIRPLAETVEAKTLEDRFVLDLDGLAHADSPLSLSYSSLIDSAGFRPFESAIQ